jgi:predicted translin family RNA/ssDNA-binding protein
MFKATRESIEAQVRNIGIAQAYGVVSLSQTNTGVMYLSAIAKADDMEAEALKALESLKATLNSTGDWSTQSRMSTAIEYVEALFEA